MPGLQAARHRSFGKPDKLGNPYQPEPEARELTHHGKYGTFAGYLG